MMRSSSALAAGLACLLASAGADSSQSSRLQIQIPTELFRSAGYEHQEALFGIPHYGGSIAQRLVYPGDFDQPYQLCSDVDAAKFTNPNPNQPFILLVDRGGADCTFVSKVRRAQHLGAAGAIIVDDRCKCADTQCVNGVVACEQLEPIMADDGSGADITIPSFLMTKPDGDVIKEHLKLKEFLQVEMTWSLPAPDDRVEWSLWTTAIDAAAAAFKGEMADVAAALGTHAYFTPHYTIYDGEEYGCRGDAHHCGNLCTNAGRYCNPDPDFDRDSGLSGADVIRETLRQKCIWLHYGGAQAPEADQGVGIKWWSYVNKFTTLCNTDKFTDETCVASAMSECGIDKTLIGRCMTESGGLDGDIDNTLLTDELTEKSTKSIVVTPTVYVNNVVERGGITAASVLNTVCSGYASGTEPSACKCAGQGSSSAVRLCISNGMRPGGGGGGGGGGVSLATVVAVVLAAALAMSAVGLLYYRKQQAAMRDQVRGILAEYMPLEDMDAAAAGGGGGGAAAASRMPFMVATPPQGGGGGGNGYAAPKDTHLV